MDTAFQRSVLPTPAVRRIPVHRIHTVLLAVFRAFERVFQHCILF